MKKRFLLLVALAIVASLLSGCFLTDILELSTRSKTNSSDVPYIDEPLDGEGSLTYEIAYDMAAAPSDGAMMAAGMPYAVPEPIEFNTEEYAAIRENGFRAVATSPLSTFSADVDTASYCNLRRMINDGWALENIPSGAVRIEEMLNYFRYDYPEPEDGKKFSVTAQIAPCPWNAETKLLMVGVRAGEVADAAQEGSNLVFLVDVSGSMYDNNKLPLAQQALKLLAEQLTENDTVSIVTYASNEKIIIDGANPVKDRSELLTAIDSLYADGATAGEKGLQQAYDVAMHNYRPHGNNRVILCSDGDLNVGITSESDLHDFVDEKKETGVYLSVLGFGEGNYKDTKMETLADHGNGSYYYIDSILEARKVLCEELTQTLHTVADDVKFQIEFNPAMVAQYRQIGYENRALEDADFEDDTKDAGEVGSGASVTLLYELVPAGSEAAEDSGLKYQTSALTEAGQSDEWLTLSVRYKEPGKDASLLEEYPVGAECVAEAPSGDFNFACAVAEFGMLIRGSEYAKGVDFDSVLALLKDAPLNDEYREEFFSLVKILQRTAKLAE